jgi:hypothetical protein
MDFPPDIRMQYGIQEGSVFYFVEDTFKTPEPHNFVVLNCDPINDEILILACATTLSLRSWVRVSGMPEETLVRLDEKDCNFLKHSTLFDCNKPLEKPKALLLQKLTDKKLKFHGVVAAEVLEKLRKGVLLSRLVSEKCKKKIRP